MVLKNPIREIEQASSEGGIKKILLPKGRRILTIKMIQEIIVNLQQDNQITICICDHQARDLLACVDSAMILSNCKIVATGTPSSLIQDINAQNAYFGSSFKIS